MRWRTERRAGVLVYDPDGVNPYGREVALHVARAGVDVTCLIAADAEWSPAAVEQRNVLPRNRTRPGRLRQGISLLHGLTLAAAAAASGRQVIVAWTRTAFEEAVFAALATFRRPVIFVIHNPVERAAQRAFRRMTRRALCARATKVVAHGPRLAALVSRDFPRARVWSCPHPPFNDWAQWAAPDDAATRADGPRLALIGQLREDKGLRELPAILSQLAEPLRARTSLTVIGRGAIPPAVADEIEELGLRLEDRSSTSFVADLDLARLLRGTVVLAPYSGQTQSGSVVLALSLGLPVVAYSGGAVDDLARWGATIVAAGDRTAFSEAVALLIEGPAPPRRSLEEWSIECTAAWADAIRISSSQ